MKRICRTEKSLLIPYIPRFLDEISVIDQASAQWTLAQLFKTLRKDMSEDEFASAKAILKRNLEKSDDWIVLNQTMATLAEWLKKDEQLKEWLTPQLERLTADPRKSVAGRAEKLFKAI
jgi:hypothetical protein